MSKLAANLLNSKQNSPLLSRPPVSDGSPTRFAGAVYMPLFGMYAIRAIRAGGQEMNRLNPEKQLAWTLLDSAP